MTQGERRLYLIKELLHERAKHANMEILTGKQEQKNLFWRMTCE